MNVGTSKDFFLQLGAIITFYASAIALITLLFEVINFAYPKVTNYYQYYFPSISFQVATLIVAFPIFIALSWFLQKNYAAEPALRESLVRRWLAYITLFIAGGVVAGDLVTLIYMFLDGQELTTGFLLKVLALLVIAGGVFFYYLREIRNQIGGRERNIWRAVAAVVVLASIVIGFMVVGSPAEQRARRYDNQRVQDLQNIQWQVVNYWQQKGRLPETLQEINDPLSGFSVPVDPQTKEPYEYFSEVDKAGMNYFRLCAEFNMESTGTNIYSMPTPTIMASDAYGRKINDNWTHGVGTECFDRTIDPELYPVRPR